MSTLNLEKLAPLVDRRFQSFAEATDAALDSLAASLPGCIVLTQIELDGGVCRVFDFRGPNFVGTERAMVMPTDGERVDAAFLDSLGVKDVISVPVELNAGIVGGVLLAISPEENSYTREHSTVIAIAARVLGYEWERVRTRAELRTLLQQVRDGDQYDPETGLRNRVGFEELLHREWRLARRGTLPSTVVAIRIEMSSDEPDGAAALKHLAAKDAAEVLAGAARGTDHVGRIGEWSSDSCRVEPPGTGMTVDLTAVQTSSSVLEGAGITGATQPAGRGGFLSDVVVDLGYATCDEVDRAVAEARGPGKLFERVLIKRGAIDEDQLARAIAERDGFAHVDLDEFALSRSRRCRRSASAGRRRSQFPTPSTTSTCQIRWLPNPPGRRAQRLRSL